MRDMAVELAPRVAVMNTIAILLLLGFQTDRTDRVAWMDATPHCAALEVIATLQDGRKLKGSWIENTASQFSIKTHKGIHIHERKDLKQLETRKRRVRGRVIGTIASYALGAGLVSLISRSAEGAQGPLAFVGYYVGKSMDLDRRLVEFY
jgi:hypothetical protein